MCWDPGHGLRGTGCGHLTRTCVLLVGSGPGSHWRRASLGPYPAGFPALAQRPGRACWRLQLQPWICLSPIALSALVAFEAPLSVRSRLGGRVLAGGRSLLRHLRLLCAEGHLSGEEHKHSRLLSRPACRAPQPLLSTCLAHDVQGESRNPQGWVLFNPLSASALQLGCWAASLAQSL